MDKKQCSVKKILIREFVNDWLELNIPFKTLIILGAILFIVVIGIAFFSDGGNGIKNTIEVVFRTTLASIFGFLLSSNIKFNKKQNNINIEKIKGELSDIELKLDSLEDDLQEDIDNTEKCEIYEYYHDQDTNMVQISIALIIAIISICALCVLLITNNLDNAQSISQLRDLMCSSVGFLIGESKKN